jgi:hypothetical protein
MFHSLPEVQSDQREQREVAHDDDVIGCVQTGLHTCQESSAHAKLLTRSELTSRHFSGELIWSAVPWHRFGTAFVLLLLPMNH